jgi:multifunctional beta-oxidation protein
MFGKGGANVVVNDLNEKAGKAVVEEIVKNGGKAIWNGDSVLEGAKVIQTALTHFGSVHVSRL